MPPVAAPSPYNGEAAQGHWTPTEPDLVADAASPPGPRTSEPALQPTAAARAAAVGILLAAGAVPLALIAIATLAALWLLFAAADRVEFDLTAQGLLVAGYALAYVAVLAVPNRWVAPRSGTLLLAVIASVAWPVSGAHVPAALVAVVFVGLALARDIHAARGPRGPWPAAALGAIALALVLTGLALADTHRIGGGETPPTAVAPVDAGGDDEARGGDTPLADATSPRAEPPSGDAEPGPAPGDARPASPPPPAATRDADPTALIRDYYTALDERRFEDAWAVLSPAVRRGFGGFAHWREGYARTISSRPRDFTVEGATVRHVLVARDDGCPTRRFSVRWVLVPRADGFGVSALTATALDDLRC